MTLTGKQPSDNLVRHMRQSVFHGALHLLLDNKFRDAWINGIKITFADGVERLVFPRIFTYSADYPEK
jgi:hypothetical protein